MSGLKVASGVIYRWKIYECGNEKKYHLGMYDAHSLKWIKWIKKGSNPSAVEQANTAATMGLFAPSGEA